MIRDEIAWKLATKLFPHVPWAELYPLKQNICLELADALMPIVERVAREAAYEAMDDRHSEAQESARLDAIVRRVMGNE